MDNATFMPVTESSFHISEKGRYIRWLMDTWTRRCYFPNNYTTIVKGFDGIGSKHILQHNGFAVACDKGGSCRYTLLRDNDIISSFKKHNFNLEIL